MKGWIFPPQKKGTEGNAGIVTFEEIEAFVKEHAHAAIEFTKLAEAREFRETLTLLEQLNKLAEVVQEEGRFPGSLLE